MGSCIKRAYQVWLRSRVLLWSAIVTFLLFHLFLGISIPLQAGYPMEIFQFSYLLSLPLLIFCVLFSYEYLRQARSPGLGETLAAIPGGVRRTFFAQLAVLGSIAAAFFLTFVAWHTAVYLAFTGKSAQVYLHFLAADVCNVLLVSIIGIELGALLTRCTKRLKAYALCVLVVFLNSPVVDAIRNILSYLPRTVSDACNAVFDLFVITPQQLTFALDSSYGMPLETFRWQVACGWALLLGGALALTRLRGRQRVGHAGWLTRLPQCAVSLAGVVLVLLSLHHGYAKFYDLRAGGMSEEPLAYSQDATQNYQFKNPGFTVKSYDMNLQINKQLTARVAMELDAPQPPDAYVFTLYSGMRIRNMTDADGKQVAYTRDGDFFTVQNDPQYNLHTLRVEYSGFSPSLPVNRQGLSLPGYFCYYPMPGNRLTAMQGRGFLAHDMVNGEDTQFTVRLAYPKTVYTNLTEVSPGVYTGKAKTATFAAGMLEMTQEGTSSYISSILNRGAFPDAEQINKTLDICNQLFDTKLSLHLDGKQVYYTSDNSPLNIPVVAFGDHVFIYSGTDNVSQTVNYFMTQLPSQTKGDYASRFLSSDFEFALRSYLKDGYAMSEEELNILPPQGMEPSVSDYFKQALKRHGDVKTLQAVYRYLAQENPQQPPEQFLKALAAA